MTGISLDTICARQEPKMLIDSKDFASAMFPVSLRPVGIMVADEFTSIGRNAVYRQDTGDTLYIGSGGYNLIKNEDIVLGLEPLYLAGYEKVKVRNINNKKFMFELKSEAFEDLRINDYPCVARVRVCNSYDGSTSLSLQFGVYIQVCGNGLCVDAKTFTGNIELSYRHTKAAPDDIAEWINNSTVGAMPMIRKRLESLVFNNQGNSAKWRSIAKLLPTPRGGGFHPLIEKLGEETRKSMVKYDCNEDFALLMAATNMATYPDVHGISPTYVEVLEDAATGLLN